MPAPTEQQIFETVRETVINSISIFIQNRIDVVPPFQILDLIIPVSLVPNV